MERVFLLGTFIRANYILLKGGGGECTVFMLHWCRNQRRSAIHVQLKLGYQGHIKECGSNSILLKWATTLFEFQMIQNCF